MVVDQSHSTSQKEALIKFEHILMYVLGVVQVFLLLRLLFMAFGANPGSVIVQFVYSVTNALLVPFAGIFEVAAAGESVIEPAIFVAMLVYYLLARGIIELAYIITK